MTGAEQKRLYRLNYPERERQSKREYRERHAERVREQQRAFRERNPEQVKAYHWKSHLKNRYGLTVEEYDALWGAQGESCAICATKDAQRWHIDHCHDGGGVRAILCSKCNCALGMADDSIDRLLDLANYLRKHECQK